MMNFARSKHFLIFFLRVNLAMMLLDRSSHPELFCTKGALKIFAYSQENTCARVSFLIKSQASGILEGESSTLTLNNLDLCQEKLRNVSYQERCNLRNDNPIFMCQGIFSIKLKYFPKKLYLMVHRGK